MPHPRQGIFGSNKNRLLSHTPQMSEICFQCKQQRCQPAGSCQSWAPAGRHSLPGCPVASPPRCSNAERGKRHTMTQGVSSICQPGAVPRAGIGMALSQNLSVPTPKPSLSQCLALLTGERQAAEAGVAKIKCDIFFSPFPLLPLREPQSVLLGPDSYPLQICLDLECGGLCQSTPPGSQLHSTAQPPYCLYI